MSKKENLGDLITDNKENAEELSVADIKVTSDKDKIEKKISKLILDNKQNAEELGAAYKIITTQEKEIKKQAADLIRVDKQKEKHKADLLSAKKELMLAAEKAKLVGELTLVNKELSIQITERKQTEKALFESEEKFRLLFNQAPLGYQALDFDGNFMEVNQTWLDTLGYTREEVIGKWFGDFLSPAYQDGFRQRFPIFKAQGHIHSEFEMVHKNGSKIFIAFEGKIGYDNKGEFKQTHGILQDITERKQWEYALQESEAKHSAMISNISDVIGIIGADGLIKYESPNIEKWFGWQPKDLIGTDGFPRVHPDDIERVKNEFFALFEKENSTITSELKYKCKDGSYKQIEITAKNLTNDPVINGVLLNYHDITDRKQAENALRESEKRFHHLFSASPDAIMLLDPTDPSGGWPIVNCNEVACTMNGYRREELIGQSIDMLNISIGTPEERAEYLESLR